MPDAARDRRNGQPVDSLSYTFGESPIQYYQEKFIMSQTMTDFKIVRGFLQAHAAHLHARSNAMHTDKDTQRAIESHARECERSVHFITGVMEQQLDVETSLTQMRKVARESGFGAL